MIYIIAQQYYVLDNRYYESKNLCSYEKKYIYIFVLLNVKKFLDILFIHGGKLIEITDCYRCMF